MDPNQNLRAILIAEDTWISARAINRWCELGHEIAEVWCFSDRASLLRRPHRPLGLLFPTWDTRRIIKSRGISVRLFPPLKTWEGSIERARKLEANSLLTCMTHQIIPRTLLEHFGSKALNLHPSILPAYRGVVPRMGMMLDGKEQEYGGITLHVLTPGIDEGPIIGQTQIPLREGDSYFDWDARIAQAGADLFEKFGVPYLKGLVNAFEQDHSIASYRKTYRGEFTFRKTLTYAQAEHLLHTSGRSGSLRCTIAREDGKEKSYRVVGMQKIGEHPLGKAPDVRFRHIDFDLQDARVRFKRRQLQDRIKDFNVACKAIQMVTSEARKPTDQKIH